MAEAVKKRLFTGFEIEAPHERLRELIRRLRVSFDRANIDVDWVAARNLHVTLNFLGTVELERVPSVEGAMRQAAGSAFATDLRGVGGFPDIHHTRTLWIGVRNDTELSELQSRLDERLRALGFDLETRPYTPHLTIGKIRKARSISDAISPFVRKEVGEVQVRDVVLYESVNHGGRPEYKAIARVRLESSSP